MAYKKGESGNLKGRPKGTTKRKAKDIRAELLALVDTEQIKRDLASLPAGERLDAVTKILPYVLPKVTPQMARTEESDFDLSFPSYSFD